MTRNVILQGTGNMVWRIPGDTMLESMVKRRCSLRAKLPVATREGGFRRSRVASHLAIFLRNPYVSLSRYSLQGDNVLSDCCAPFYGMDGSCSTCWPKAPFRALSSSPTKPHLHCSIISVAGICLPSAFTGSRYALWRSVLNRQMTL